LSGFWVQNVIGRIVPDEDYTGGHRNGPLYYAITFPGLALPWILALPWGAREAWRRRPARPPPPALAPPGQRAQPFLPLSIPGLLLLLSIPGTKRALYALPVLVPCALLTAGWIITLPPRGRRLLQRGTWLLFGVAVTAHLLGGFVQDPERDLTPLASDLRV